MKNAIILHGAPEKKNYYNPDLPSESNAHWLPWLQKELIIRDITAQTPEIPISFEPKWDLWCQEISRYDITPETMLVGHSAGGGFWLKYLSQKPQLRVGKVVLVAPWLDPGKTLAENFFAGEIDPDVASRTTALTVFISDDDSDSTRQSVARIREKVKNLKVREFSGYGHFNYDNLKGEAFVELRDELLL